jgi:hypothetical protein
MKMKTVGISKNALRQQSDIPAEWEVLKSFTEFNPSFSVLLSMNISRFDA